jgi:RNA polymerase sigma-70 factor (ECF subfamily)
MWKRVTLPFGCTLVKQNNALNGKIEHSSPPLGPPVTRAGFLLLRCADLRGTVRGNRSDGACAAAGIHGAGRLATYQELAEFLAKVERRAYKQALFAVRDDHLALDIVQDAMLKLTEKYSARTLDELPLLFQRILQNTILDFYRRQKVRSTWTLAVSSLLGSGSDEDADPLETLDVADDSKFSGRPAEQAERSQLLAFIEKALEKLPARQRQAFLLRYWEELNVAEAAKIMGCSVGSVKTHCSRATHALSVMLGKQGIKP